MSLDLIVATRQVRDGFKSALAGNTSVGDNVFASRVFPIQSDLDSAIMLSAQSFNVERDALYFLNRTTEYLRTLRVRIDGYVKHGLTLLDKLDL